ncbi:NAD(P)H-quinone oxidoreductase [Proteus vulgaris]|uniref:NAD(P)H-quinone oxidoreductase n=1 Tax=Proteus TaxID=583 RepID=UPI00141346B5|nr:MULTISPECIES: NAD(P)H-quinone oxidoreductase [Proteus]NBM56568.1 zinc-binding dehydrogenase [Proteus sp. G2669]UDN38041.1 NAD(P)H-quinone oxidoreductase [Proteus sp. NMG38-2]UPK79380.1 NAD(P)H-quinone oxidoreductase [Proteus vulgaris]
MMNTVLPANMLEIAITEPGDIDKLQAKISPIPSLPPHYLLIKVAVSGVNRPDIFQRQGSYPPPADASPIPGLEVSGEVVALGESCTKWQLGDRVCALVAGGGYSQYCIAHEDIALPSMNLTDIEAAALPENFFTVWANLFQLGKLKQGESVLIHGGTSGIGSTAIMLAHAIGATIYTTVGSEEKKEVAYKIGADYVINYKQTDFAKEIPILTHGKGVDVVLDIIGGDYVEKNYQVASKFGRIIQVGMMKGMPKNVNMMPMMVKRLIHTGSTMRSRSVEEKAHIAQELKQHVWPLIAEGKIKPIINAIFPLTEAGKAHQLMESGDLIGKVVLENTTYNVNDSN